jgi:hypothetical protein
MAEPANDDGPEHRRRRLRIAQDAALTISLFGTLIALITILVVAMGLMLMLAK